MRVRVAYLHHALECQDPTDRQRAVPSMTIPWIDAMHHSWRLFGAASYHSTSFSAMLTYESDYMLCYSSRAMSCCAVLHHDVTSHLYSAYRTNFTQKLIQIFRVVSSTFILSKKYVSKM